MTALNLQEFQQAMEPVLQRMRAEKQTLEDFARNAHERPRTLTAPEFLLLLAHECRLLYSRREKNYD